MENGYCETVYGAKTQNGTKKDTSQPLPKVYNPVYVEAAWYDWWKSNKFFEPESGSEIGKEETFVMLLPPPNITGCLHLGHALTCSIQDALCRWHRMHGHTVLWLPGTDHAGIATQVAVEKSLLSQGHRTRHQIGRSNFQSEVWKWKDENEQIIEEQLESLGSSLAWSRRFFTLDQKLCRAVDEAFVQLYDRGLLKRDRRLVNWCCALQSTVSDIEVEHIHITGRTPRKVPGHPDSVDFGILTSFAYRLENGDAEIVVSTTRSETMFGDVALAVHPEDDRYGHLVGKRIRHPLCSGRTLPIIADFSVDMNFGTGAVKLTPAHNQDDLEICRRHRLPEINVIGMDGCISGEGVPPEFVGMPRFAARRAVNQALSDLGLWRGDVEHSLSLPVCSRSGDVLEAMLRDQWFLDCRKMSDNAMKAVNDGQLTFSSPHLESVWFDFLSKGRDWCLSRQLWWGHKVPAYRVQTSRGELWLAARSEAEAVERFRQRHPGLDCSSISRDDDVLDTWFSSALLPFSVFGWPEQTVDLKKFYPLSLMETGQDILFFWVARMVMLGLELTGQLPFRHWIRCCRLLEIIVHEVLHHGMVRDASNRKMSKSLGNVIDPRDIIQGASLEQLHTRLRRSNLSDDELTRITDGQRKDYPQGIPQCGTDALRFTLCSYNYKAETVPVDVSHMRSHRLLCNKIWQASHYCHLQWPGDFQPLQSFALSGQESAVDMWILSRMRDLVEACDVAFTTFNLQQATKAVILFWLNDFCDVYLEHSKLAFQTGRLGYICHQETTRQILYYIMDTFLRCLSPFMPFLTEELFQRLPRKPGNRPESVCLAQYPSPDQFPWRSSSLENVMSEVLKVSHHVQSIRQEYKILKPILPVHIVLTDEGVNASALAMFKSVLYKLCKADPVYIYHDGDDTAGCAPTIVGCAPVVVSDRCRLYVELKDQLNAELELHCLSEKYRKVKAKYEKLTHRLAKATAIGKVEEVGVSKAFKKKEHLDEELRRIRSSMDMVGRMAATK